MKHNRLIYTILIVILFGCQNYKKEVIISGKISGDIPKEVKFSEPINGTIYNEFSETVKPDSFGNFQIKIDLKKPSFIYFTLPNEFSFIMIAEPGQKYEVSMNLVNDRNTYSILGKEDTAQQLYNSLPRPDFMQGVARGFLKDSSSKSIKEKLSLLKSKDIFKFKELLDKKEISSDFFELVKVDRDCYYSDLAAEIILLKYYISSPEQRKLLKKEMEYFCDSILNEFPINDNKLLHSCYWYLYAENFIKLKERIDKNYNPKLSIELDNKGLTHTHNIEEAEKILTGTMLEYFKARYIYIQSFQRDYEKEFISIFEVYKKNYPQSGYTKYLQPMINPIVEYHKVAEQPFSPQIRMLENFEKINTLKDAVKPFYGKMIYVDVWASWCGPCKDEFQYKDKLIQLLKSKGVELLCISIDKDERNKQWENLIKFYNLEGNHIRANSFLLNDLIKIFNFRGAISIPWYILIDKKGEILNKFAPRPSNLKDLEEELNKI